MKTGKKVLATFFLLTALTLVTFCVTQNVFATCNESTAIIINSCDHDHLLSKFLELQKCVEENGKATAYVGGNGGAISNALMFFDLMRTTSVGVNTTFISAGGIISASNIVWLSAATRIVTPSSSFLVHGATWNKSGEDARVRSEDIEHLLTASSKAVKIATTEKTSRLWKTIFRGSQQGHVFNAEKAIANGWATELHPYKITN